jgi:hypothetical protein
VKPLKLFEQLGLRAIGLGLRRVEGEVPGYPFDHVAYSGTAERLQEALLEWGSTWRFVLIYSQDQSI